MKHVDSCELIGKEQLFSEMWGNPDFLGYESIEGFYVLQAKLESLQTVIDTEERPDIDVYGCLTEWVEATSTATESVIASVVTAKIDHIPDGHQSIKNIYLNRMAHAMRALPSADILATLERFDVMSLAPSLPTVSRGESLPVLLNFDAVENRLDELIKAHLVGQGLQPEVIDLFDRELGVTKKGIMSLIKASVGKRVSIRLGSFDKFLKQAHVLDDPKCLPNNISYADESNLFVSEYGAVSMPKQYGKPSKISKEAMKAYIEKNYTPKALPLLTATKLTAPSVITDMLNDMPSCEQPVLDNNSNDGVKKGADVVEMTPGIVVAAEVPETPEVIEEPSFTFFVKAKMAEDLLGSVGYAPQSTINWINENSANLQQGMTITVVLSSLTLVRGSEWKMPKEAYNKILDWKGKNTSQSEVGVGEEVVSKSKRIEAFRASWNSMLSKLAPDPTLKLLKTTLKDSSLENVRSVLMNFDWTPPIDSKALTLILAILKKDGLADGGEFDAFFSNSILYLFKEFNDSGKKHFVANLADDLKPLATQYFESQVTQ